MNSDRATRIHALRQAALRCDLALDGIGLGYYAFLRRSVPAGAEEQAVFWTRSLKEAEAFAAGIEYALRGSEVLAL